MTASFDEDVLESATELKELGFAIHWLKPESKAPVQREWQNTPPLSLDQLKKTHKTGFNIGVRLGKPSHLADGMYLHVLDFDIRVKGLKAEVIGKFNELFPHIDLQTLPRVKSGSAGDSFHAYFVSDKPFHSKKLAQSDAKIRKYNPVAKRESWSREWEIELFGTLKQVVIPPSIHPETKNQYKWVEKFNRDLYDLGITPYISSETIEELLPPVDETFIFEDQEPIKISDKELTKILDALPYDYINDHDTWVALGQALHHQFGGSDKGFDLWMQYSAKSEKFDENDIPTYRRSRWRSFGRYQGGQLVTLRSVIEAVRKAAQDELLSSMDEIEESETAPINKTGAVAAVVGDITSEAEEQEDDDYVVSANKTDWTSLLAITEDGNLKNNLHNITLIVKNDNRMVGVIRQNTFTNDTVLMKKPNKRKRKDGAKLPPVNLTSPIWDIPDPVNGRLIHDYHLYDIRSLLEAPRNQGGYNIKVSDRDLVAAIGKVASANQFHPVKLYLESQKWDGVERLDQFFVKYLNTEDNEYYRECARIFLIAAVTRIYEPAHKFDFAPILEGAQGAKKSTFISILAKSWFSELKDDFSDTKKMVESMQGSWIIEIPELTSFKKSDVRAIKAFMSTRVDKQRMSYERYAQLYPRQCVFMGSTNDTEYLNDPTGGRRFLPIHCGETLNVEGLIEDVDQVWAEALVRYRALREEFPTGTLPLYVKNEEAAVYAKEMQESRTMETEESLLAGKLEEWLDTPIIGEINEADEFGEEPTELRDTVCLFQIREEMLGETLAQITKRNFVLEAAMNMLCKQGRWRKGKSARLPRYGKQRIYSRVK